MKRSEHEKVVITRRVCNNCVYFIRDDADTSNESTHGSCTIRMYPSGFTNEEIQFEVDADQYCSQHERYLGEKKR